MTVTFGNALPENGVRETRWLTPPHIVESLGSFDLDPCGAPGHELAQTNYQIDDGQDGLVLPWFGRVWLNPPYGREGEPFMRRMVEHGKGTALLFARTETRAFFENIWDHASAVLFLRGRLKFLRADLSSGGSANAPSVLIAYGNEDALALQHCGIPGKFIRLSGGNDD